MRADAGEAHAGIALYVAGAAQEINEQGKNAFCLVFRVYAEAQPLCIISFFEPFFEQEYRYGPEIQFAFGMAEQGG